MTEYFSGDYINNVLINDATVTSLVGATSIYNSRLVPISDTSAKTINFYSVGNYDGTLEYPMFRWSISCRANTDYEAEAIAIAVFNALNRYGKTVSTLDHFSVASILPVIGPVDDSDNYNRPVEVTIKRR